MGYAVLHLEKAKGADSKMSAHKSARAIRKMRMKSVRI